MVKAASFNNFSGYMARKIKIAHVFRVEVKLKKYLYPIDRLFIARNVKSKLLTEIDQRGIHSVSMANTISAVSRTKKTIIQTKINKIRKSKYKSAIKKMSGYIASGKAKEAKEFLPKFHSQLMKIAKTGLVSKKKASRKISRVTSAIKKLK